MSILNLEGAYENELTTTGEFNQLAAKTALTLPSGQRVVLPTEVLLQALEDHHGEAPPAANPLAASPTRQAPGIAEVDQVIPLVEEQLLVGKREVEKGRLRLRRETEEHVQTVSVPLTETRWEVEHVKVDQRVDAQPQIRTIGETTVFPLVEERLVVVRELWLREEVHVRRVTSTTEQSADFALKRDVLIEDRSGNV